jgi:NADH-quinone oxidoreductase subunit N
MWFEDPSGSYELGSQPVGLYAAVMIAAVGTLLLLPGFAPVIETAQAAASTLFA